MNLSPEDEREYNSRWVVLNRAFQTAKTQGSPEDVKRCRQALSELGALYKARELPEAQCGDTLLSLLQEIADEENAVAYPSAIERNNASFDFEDWMSRVRIAILE